MLCVITNQNMWDSNSSIRIYLASQQINSKYSSNKETKNHDKNLRNVIQGRHVFTVFKFPSFKLKQ